MKGKTILYCGIFIFLTSLLLIFFNLLRSGVLQIFLSSENSAGIGSVGGGLISLILLVLPVLGLIIGFFLTVFGIIRSARKNPLP